MIHDGNSMINPHNRKISRSVCNTKCEPGKHTGTNIQECKALLKNGSGHVDVCQQQRRKKTICTNWMDMPHTTIAIDNWKGKPSSSMTHVHFPNRHMAMEKAPTVAIPLGFDQSC